MMEHAWSNYVTYAWGANELDPISKDVNYHTVFGGKPTGASIVDALDTLYMMGMKEEYERASQWVKEKLDFDVVSREVPSGTGLTLDPVYMNADSVVNV